MSDAAKIIDWMNVEEYPHGDGAYVNVPEESYHADRTRMSKHQLDTFARSPAHWLAEYRGKSKKCTDPMTWGGALDALVTDPDRFERVYRPGPNVSRNTKVWKDFVKGLEPGQIPLKEADYRNIIGARQAAHDHELANLYLFGDRVIYQLTLNWTWQYRRYRVLMRSRLDAVTIVDGQVIIADLKRAHDARGEAFSKQIANFNYHVQQACYMLALRTVLALEVVDFVFVAIEPEPHHGIVVHRLPRIAHELGVGMLHDTLLRFAHCAANEDYSSYEPKVNITGLPAWYMKRQQRQLEELI